MITKRYKIADVSFEMSSYFDYVHKESEDFITEETPAFSIISTKEKIEYEKMIFNREYKRDIDISDDILESTAILRMLTFELLKYNILLFHGSCVSVDDKAYLFTAKSGTGKSTHTKNYLKVYKDRAKIINDDKPFLKINNDSVFVYGSPWNGKDGIPYNSKAKLSAICVLSRSKENHIRKVLYKDIFHMLMQQVYRPENKDDLTKTVLLLEKINSLVDFYSLECNTDEMSAKVSYEGMNNIET